jgi:hypothetical protein
MNIISQDGMMPMNGPPGRATLGDYVMTDRESLAAYMEIADFHP